MFAALALAVGLAMDATAVAAARGVQRGAPRDLVILPLLFGVFQGGMVALGWMLGAWGGPYVERYDHWIAFVLLVGIGGKMLTEGWRDRNHPPGEEALPAKTRQTPLLYLGLALATSIDAAAAGLTLPLLPVAPVVAIVLVGLVTAALSAAGYLLGRAAGAKFGSRLEALGGLILIGIAVKLLVEHL